MVLRGSASGGVQRKVRLLRHQKVAYCLAASRSYSQQHPRTADRRFYTDDFPSHVYRESQRGFPYVSVISVLAS